jgi:hypothetical protein
MISPDVNREKNFIRVMGVSHDRGRESPVEGLDAARERRRFTGEEASVVKGSYIPLVSHLLLGQP